MPITAWIAVGIAMTRPAADFEPTSSYQTLSVQGFTVRVSKAAKQAREDFEPAMALLRLRLDELVRRVPATALGTLRKIPVWVEKDDPKVKCMCYHPDVGWLRENGLNPDKAKSVEIGSVKTFVSWSIDQPSMVLHEYAHGFHDLSCGFQDEAVLAAFQSAMKDRLYDEVSYYRGQKKKAYAATNQMEYFAELSEALFGFNDYFPFTRPELERHDPKGCATVKKAWGVND